jgi:hypothetical protein
VLASSPAKVIAETALDTLLVLMKHQRACPQCRLDERYCETGMTYQGRFMDELRRYVRSRDLSRT